MFRRGGERVGFFCISKGGHDAGEYYVIVSAAGSFVHVANGKNKTIAMPKKKNLAHLEITKTQIPEFDRLLNGKSEMSNLRLAELIKNFKRRKENGGV